MGKYHEEKAKLKVEAVVPELGPHDATRYRCYSNLDTGKVTILGERAVGILRDRKVGAFYDGDKLTIEPEPLWDEQGCPVWAVIVEAYQHPQGGGPYDKVEVRVCGTHQRNAVGMLCEWIRTFGTDGNVMLTRREYNG